MPFPLWTGQGIHQLIDSPFTQSENQAETSADSGYASSLGSPTPKTRRRNGASDVTVFGARKSSPNLGRCLDGPSDGLATPANILTPVGSRLNILSEPLPRCRPSLKPTDSDSSIKSSSSRSPDRFLPSRRTTLNSATQSFRTNKSLDELSPDEKLLRHRGASTDAFYPPRRIFSTPIASPNRASAQRTFSSGSTAGGSVLSFQNTPLSSGQERQISVGTIWSVGGIAPSSITGVSNGRGRLLASGTNAPFHTTSFSGERPKNQEDTRKHEGRLAEALGLDRVQRVLEFREPSLSPLIPGSSNRGRAESPSKTVWQGTEWVPQGEAYILDAPNLRDDFYCSILAYCYTGHTLAVGLGSLLYAWSEKAGVQIMNAGTGSGAWLTSLAFSSTEGCKCIIAFGRNDGTLTLMSLRKQDIPGSKPGIQVFQPRFEIAQPAPIACVKWRPTVTMRPSRSPLTRGMLVRTEDLVVGDEIGNVYCYSVEWPEYAELSRDGWAGSMTLIALISIHTQQICGLSFNLDGSLLATGGNDNLCCLFQSNSIFRIRSDDGETAEETFDGVIWGSRLQPLTGHGRANHVRAGAEKHRWHHGAAVKAIAFCPWRDGLVATGGGSNDKCIHFFHTGSGACLATISVAAQVTSLIWSTTRRELVATFGYAQPDHPYRIAVFSWPDCKQVAAIPWDGEHRALYAIAYPGGPNEGSTSREGGRGMSRTAQEGCIVVASSDESVKFHEVWTSGQKATIGGGEGLLGGSDILESLEGIDKEGDLIR